MTTGGTTTTTHYLRDASGNVMAIYKDTQLAEQPIYGSSRLGQYTGRPEPGMRIWQRKMYELSNHLGNVLAVVGDGYTTSSGNKEAWISSLQDYYPFGLAMEGRSSNLGGYRFGFNGKERDPASEWGQTSYDYGFRIYNPEIGKFLSVDPLTNEYPELTHYQFASNRPIDGVDLDGLEYLNANVSRIKVIGGEAYLNLDNFNDGTKRAWKQRDLAVKSGQVILEGYIGGYPTKVAEITDPNYPKFPNMESLSFGNAEKFTRVGDMKTKPTNRNARRYYTVGKGRKKDILLYEVHLIMSKVWEEHLWY